MPEILLHYIWQHGLWAGYPQETTDGRPVEIISVGQHNADAGPDFSNVHLIIGDQDWVGNVEIHVNSSDWYRHRHHLDRAYDSVILHVVRKADKRVYNTEGEAILQCELRYPDDHDYLTALLEEAFRMDSPESRLHCAQIMKLSPAILTEGWRHTMLRQRLECKQQSIMQLLQITKQSWEHAFYITLAHHFGFHVNGIPFEMLAIHTPLSCLQKHKNSLFQLTAILLGQSGLLAALDSPDAEQLRLLQEYQHLSRKFSLEPIDAALWKRSRMRPQSQPEVRIRQFAALLYQSEHLFRQLMEAPSVDALRQLFTLQACEANGPLAPYANLGRDSIDSLIINAVIPYRFAYAMSHHDAEAAEQAYLLMEALPAEDNRIVRQWRLLGQQVHHAADTQALIHLYLNYCQSHQCLHCDIGYQIFIDKQLKLF